MNVLGVLDAAEFYGSCWMVRHDAAARTHIVMVADDDTSQLCWYIADYGSTVIIVIIVIIVIVVVVVVIYSLKTARSN